MPFDYDDPYVTVSCKVIGVTAKAVRVLDESGMTVWVPRSCVHGGDDRLLNGASGDEIQSPGAKVVRRKRRADLMAEKLHGQTRRHHCRYQNCKREASCLPRLYVPAYQINPSRTLEDCSIMLAGLYLCETCFSKLTAKEILEGERGEAIRESVIEFYKRAGAHPNFDKAVIGRVSPKDHDFGRSEDLEEKTRAN